ncbi:MAG: RsmB/NOP family class I SAM-dependent RNA methyltransferase [Paracoccaceae bacterium]|jgi:16S rRNA (cytosine967-C5)-methyltransferase|nr:RsmB/NOP family class I SAM-dependent RNA methyltransferase [Paracoccaceae bacterium]
MTPNARIASAILIIDSIIAGDPAEKVLTNWARKSRFAGSSDRSAVRDIVYDCLRSLNSFGTLGGNKTGRGVIIGYLLFSNKEPNLFFNGIGYGPSELTPSELSHIDLTQNESSPLEVLDFPDCLLDELKDSLGESFYSVNNTLKQRAPFYIRVNLSKATLDEVQLILRDEGIETDLDDACVTALKVLSNPRKVKQSDAYKTGLLDIQDLNSQISCRTIPLENGWKLLDFCAGGGGKSLALSDRFSGTIDAYDKDFLRMKDIPVRSDRAGVTINLLSNDDIRTVSSYDLVICDVPCTGSGAWRRNPDAKWTLTTDNYEALKKTQQEILDDASKLVSGNGVLVYMTCSLLKAENSDQVEAFLLRNSDWEVVFQESFPLSNSGDGFFVTHLKITS